MAAPCLRLRGERKIIELQMSRCGAALARIKVSASRGERKIIELQMCQILRVRQDLRPSVRARKAACMSRRARERVVNHTCV